MSLADKRYAEAFLQISVEQNQVKEHLEYMRNLYYLFRDNKDFRSALNNPKLDIKQKEEIANAVLQDGLPPLIINFLKVLIESGRISNFRNVAIQYRGLAYKHSKIKIVRILSAFELDVEQIKALGEKYGKLVGASSVITGFEIDQSLLGGVIIQIGDMVYDLSMSGRLKSLKKTLNWGEIYEA